MFDSPAVLHCQADGPDLLLWAETERPFRQPSRVGYRGSYHPHALPGGELMSRMMAARLVPVRGPTDVLVPVADLEAGGAAFALPTAMAGDRPLPSPAAGGDPGAAGPLVRWEVPGVRLTASGDPVWFRPFRLEGAGLFLAPEWAAWWRLAAFVRGSVARGAVAPGVADGYDARHMRPRWQLVWGGGDRAAWEAMCRALPPAANPVQLRAVNVAAPFATAYADALVRRAARGRPALRPYRRVPRGEEDPVRRWLASLLAPRPGQLPAGVGMRGRIRDWLADPAGMAGPATLVLHMGEPVAQDGADTLDRWPCAVHLERPSEPGVFLAPSEVLRAADEAEAGRPDDGAALAERDSLRQALARVVRLVPALGRPLAGAPDEADLRPDEALALLTSPPERLRDAGARLMVPSWWRPAPLRAHVRLRSAGRGLFGADALVRYDWRVAVGEAAVSAEEFERLVAQRSPFVRLHGQWVLLPPDAAAALVRRWREYGAKGSLGAGAALLMALQAEAEREPRPAADDGEAPVEVDADEAVIATLRALGGAPGELREPAGFQGALRPYQRKGLGWLAARADLGLGGILADDMGLGKTVQLLALLAHRHAEGTARGPTLVVAPTTVVANWAEEAARFVPGMRVVAHHGTGRARGASFAATIVAAQIVLTSYPLLLRDASALASVAWDGVVLDEAQNIKNAAAKHSRAARSLRAGWRFALTGTPVENALTDLWSIFAFVQPGYLGTQTAFTRRLAGPVERGADDPSAGPARETLRRLIGPLVLRRTKAERGVADELPPRIESVERCALTPEQAALYEAVARELLQRVEETTGLRRRAAVLLALLRLKQVCNHPAHYAGDGSVLADRSGKLERLVELLAEIVGEGERALVFTQFAIWGRRLATHLGERLGVAVCHLDGATPAAERAELVAWFQGTGGATRGGPRPSVFVLSVKAGGAGLNLTAAQHVFHYDRWWNPAVEQQATDRAHRIGQPATVHVHKLVCTGTLEDRIDRLIREKEALAAGVLAPSGAGEGWLTELDDPGLREVLALRREALG